MQKKSLVWLSSAIACVIVLASFTNVVGVQTVASSNNKLINDKVEQKELLFQTILDLANNKEIQKITSVSGTRRGAFFNQGILSLVFVPHVLTKKFLNTAYHIGLILSKTLIKTKIHSILERYKVNNQGMQKELAAAIEKNPELKKEMEQLSPSNCDCENDNITGQNFTILCLILCPIFVFVFEMWFFIAYGLHRYPLYLGALLLILLDIGETLNCFWV